MQIPPVVARCHSYPPAMLLLLLLIAPLGTNAASRYVIAPLRGSDDRVEVFKLPESLWFAGTGRLPAFEGGSGGGNSNGDSSASASGAQSGATRSDAAAAPPSAAAPASAPAAAAPASAPAAAAPASAPAPSADLQQQQLEARLAEVGSFSERATEMKEVVKRKPAVGFPGISLYDEVTNSGTTSPKYNNSVYRVCPPDVALCVGNGFVIHTVNIALVVYDTKGKQLTRLITHQEFFGTLPKLVELRDPYSSSVFGDGIGDMTCTYDRKAKRFYLSTYWASMGFNNTFDKFGQTRQRNGSTVRAGLLVAATTSDDPTKDWNQYFIPGTNDGINSYNDSGAPIFYNSLDGAYFMDYPQIGTDAYGFFVSVNQFPGGDDADTLLGVGIYAMSKSQLQKPENSSITRFVVPLTANHTSPAYTILPQRVAADGEYDYSHGGTMYFGWSGVKKNGGVNETALVGNYTTIGAFAITGTSALGTADAEDRIVPHCAAVNTPPYFVPGLTTQKNGPAPFAWKMNGTVRPISAGDNSALGVVVSPRKRQMWVSFMSAYGAEMAASAVVARMRLSLRPNRKSRTLRAFLQRFKAVGVGGNNSLIMPAIALNSQGKGIIAASLAGPNFYPSAAYATFNADVDVGRVVVAGAGKAPLDDYVTFVYDQPGNRYGDYMTATIDEEGNAWAAVEYVVGYPRIEWSNWATFIFKVDLGDKGGSNDSGSGDGGGDDGGGSGGGDDGGGSGGGDNDGNDVIDDGDDGNNDGSDDNGGSDSGGSGGSGGSSSGDGGSSSHSG